MASRSRQESPEKYKALEIFLGQLFSSPKVVSEGAEDVGDIDSWMMSNIPPDIMLPLLGLEAIGVQDNMVWLRSFVRTTLSALKGINGYANNIGRDIAVAGLGGGTGRKLVTKRSWVKRNITDRGGPEFEDAETGEQVQ